MQTASVLISARTGQSRAALYDDTAERDPDPPPPTLAERRAERRAALAAWRFAVETAGIRLGPIAIATDRISQQMITAAVVVAGRDAGFTTRWKAADGSFHAIDAGTMLAIGTAVAAHVNACFLREAELADAIDAAPDEAALAAIDITAGWPATS